MAEDKATPAGSETAPEVLSHYLLWLSIRAETPGVGKVEERKGHPWKTGRAPGGWEGGGAGEGKKGRIWERGRQTRPRLAETFVPRARCIRGNRKENTL